MSLRYVLRFAASYRIKFRCLFSGMGRQGTLGGFLWPRRTFGGSISFGYIDGNHTYEQSKKDFENVHRFLEPGGFIVFDDSGDDSSWESNRTAKEAASLASYELVGKESKLLH